MNSRESVYKDSDLKKAARKRKKKVSYCYSLPVTFKALCEYGMSRNGHEMHFQRSHCRFQAKSEEYNRLQLSLKPA